MLNSKSDYKKVKQDQFGSGNRITINGNVYGKRTQKLIKQNEDVVYLAEANGVVNNVRDNSILIASAAVSIIGYKRFKLI